LCEAFVYVALGNNKKIPAWIASGNLQQSLLPFPAHGYYNIIYGKALLVQADYAKLLGLAGQFHQIAAIFPNLLAHIYTYIYEAAAQDRLNHPREAELALNKALELAEPDHLLMPFVENASFIMNLLMLQAKNSPQQSLVRSILKHHPAYAENTALIQTSLTAVDSFAALLTAREKEIAGLVAAGLSNQKIAATLFVTEITIKKALQSIYAKLNINSRTGLTKIIIEHQAG
jgi:LuxR family maltose regulon positive regulatory protein